MGKAESILVVEDEKNVRMAMVRALESSGFHVESAITGEEALLMLEASPFDLVFLGLEMPWTDGLEVLRRVKRTRPAARVIVVTARGTVDSAVEAMKLGAADFMQKPFTPVEIRELAETALAPPREDARPPGYDDYLAAARRSIADGQLAAAIAHVRKAAGLDPTRPEAFNLLGAAAHLGGRRYEAQGYFRAALALDPTYEPARDNLERSVGGGAHSPYMALALGADGETAR